MAANRPFLSNTRRTPSQTRAPVSATAWGTAAAPSSPSSVEPPVTATRPASKSRPSLSLALSSPDAHPPVQPTQAHPLAHDWDILFSHRGTKEKGRKDATGAEMESSKDEWSTSVVKLGAFSSIESLLPFLAHLTPPSQLPPISEINIFRSPIAPVWEDPHNLGGGRFVLRLRKGVADRVLEELVLAVVGERLAVNGIVLSVRKDEDILGVWVAPGSRPERDLIRDSIRLALEPLLSPAASAALTLDFKPHPISNSVSVPLTAASLSPATHHRDSNTNNRERPSRNSGFNSYSSQREDKEKDSTTFGTLSRPERNDAYGSRVRRGSHGESLPPKERSAPGSWGRN